MKTIEEAKDDCISYGCLKYRESYCTAVYANGIDYGFEAGVEFAQRWINVEDELPEENVGNFSHIVLTKDVNGLIRLERYDFDSKCFNELHYGFEPTHWRPIELK